MSRLLSGLSTLVVLTACFGHAQQLSVPEHLQRAREMIVQGNSTEAMREYEAVVQADGANLEATGNLGVLQFFANDCQHAVPHLEAALTQTPTEARLRALIGVCQRRGGKLEEAEKNLTDALPGVTNPKIRLLVATNLVEMQYASGDMQGASANAPELVNNEVATPDSLYLAYRIYRALAEMARNGLTLLAPDSARMHLLTAERFIDAGYITSAIRQFQLALEADPKIPGVHYELGQAIIQESVNPESLTRAERELGLALKENPLNAGAYARLGVIEETRGHAELADAHYSRALELQPDEFNALVGMGTILQRRGNDEKAAEYLMRAAKEDPSDASLHFRLAQIYRTLGRKADADHEMKLYASVRELRSKVALGDLKRAPER